MPDITLNTPITTPAVLETTWDKLDTVGFYYAKDMATGVKTVTLILRPYREVEGQAEYAANRDITYVIPDLAAIIPTNPAFLTAFDALVTAIGAYANGAQT